MNEIIGVPHEPKGEHCVFYAVQAANIYFNSSGLTIEDRDRYQRERERRPRLFKALTGQGEARGGSHLATIPMVLRKLGEYGILPQEIVCSEKSVDFYRRMAFVRRTSAQVRGTKKIGPLNWPALFYVDEDHVWFCANQDEFNKDYGIHVGKTGKITTVIPLKKQEEIVPSSTTKK